MSIISQALKKAQKERNIDIEKRLKNRQEPVFTYEITDTFKKRKKQPSFPLIIWKYLLVILFLSLAFYTGAYLFVNKDTVLPGISGFFSDNAVLPEDTRTPSGPDAADAVADNKTVPAVLTRIIRRKPLAALPEPVIPVVSGIMYSDNPSAVIDGKIYSAGGVIGPYRIVSILPGAVILDDGEKEIRVPVE